MSRCWMSFSMLHESFSVRKFCFKSNFFASFGLGLSTFFFTEYFLTVCQSWYVFFNLPLLCLFCFSPLSSLPPWIQELLMSNLSGSTNSPSNPPHVVNFDLGSESRMDPDCFNPLHQFDHVGKKTLDQVCQAALQVVITFLFGSNFSFFTFILPLWNVFDILVIVDATMCLSTLYCVDVLLMRTVVSFLLPPKATSLMLKVRSC